MEKFFILIEYAFFNVVAAVVQKIFAGDSDVYQKTVRYGQRLRKAVQGAVDSAGEECSEAERECLMGAIQQGFIGDDQST